MKTINLFICFFTVLLTFLVMPIAGFGQDIWNGTTVPTYTMGQVGIGTLSPLSDLHIWRVSPQIRFTSTVPGSHEFLIRLFGTDGLLFKDATATGGPTRFMINPTGKIGIGTTTPDITLDVIDNIAGNAGVEIQNTSTDPNASGLLRILDPTGNSRFVVSVDENGNPDMWMDGFIKAPYFGNFQFLSPVLMEEHLYLKDANTAHLGGPLDLNIIDARDGQVGIQIQNKSSGSSSRSGITFYDKNGTRKCYMGITYSGQPEVAIGAVNVPTGYLMAVDGKLVCEEVKVMNLTAFPDYVFEEEYRLMPLEELENTIKTAKHLPGIPSAAEVAKNGVSIGEMQSKLLQKVEELTLYMIELKKENEQLKTRIANLEE